MVAVVLRETKQYNSIIGQFCCSNSVGLWEGFDIMYAMVVIELVYVVTM